MAGDNLSALRQSSPNRMLQDAVQVERFSGLGLSQMEVGLEPSNEVVARTGLPQNGFSVIADTSKGEVGRMSLLET